MANCAELLTAQERAARMSEKERKNYKEAFNMFDHDGNGWITTEEIGVVMRRLGQNPTPEELQDMIREVDADKSGHVDFEEFLVMMSMTAQHHSGELRQAFKLFDSDGDGYITLDDLKRVMQVAGERLSDTELREMFRKADQDRDNLVNFKEFQAIVTKN